MPVAVSQNFMKSREEILTFPSSPFPAEFPEQRVRNPFELSSWMQVRTIAVTYKMY
jgi:hypothetical protein